MSKLSPPPYRDPDHSGGAWSKWYASVQELLSPVATGGLTLWNSISKLGANLTDLPTRNHDDLQNLNTSTHTHLTSTNHDLLTGASDTTLHFHSADRYTLPTATSSVLGGVKPDGTSILNSSGSLSVTLASIGAQASGTYVTPTTLNNNSLPVTGTTVKAGSVAGFISSDGSTGYTGTLTTSSLVGKTVTFKDGIIVSII